MNYDYEVNKRISTIAIHYFEQTILLTLVHLCTVDKSEITIRLLEVKQRSVSICKGSW